MDTKALRQKILDLAIHGKLVPQDPNDEPASVLLERIKAEKERLIKEGKIKRSKKSAKTSDTPHYEKVPVEVPEGWAWTTVNDISKSILYGVSESAKSEGKYKLLRITDIQDNQVDWETVPCTDFDENKVSSYILYDGDIVFARTGATVGKSYLIKGLNQKAIYASYLIRVQTFDMILPEYVKLFFESGYYWEQIELSSVGIGQPNVNGTILGNLNIPLPPFAEQSRIVTEMEKWLSLIDIIEKGKANLQEAIKQAKSKILDLAIHGKLVPQDPNDEPAIELLKRINPDFTPCDNGHYEQLPQGWTTIKVGDVANYINGRAFKPEEWEQEGLPIIRIQNLNDKNASYNRTTETFESKYLIHSGDLLFAWAASLGTYIWNGNDAWLNQHIFKVEPYLFIEKQYLYYVFEAMTTEFYTQSHGSGMVHITKKQFEDIELLLPPLEEQKRIIQAIKLISIRLDLIMEGL